MSLGAMVRVRGVVTVSPGWILGDATIAIQDASAGIFVRLPDPAMQGVVPGRLLEVEGILAAPYGNLELRPVASAVHVLEMSSQPQPRNLSVAELGEGTEGLIARISVTIASIETGTSGSLTLIVEDGSGEGRVFIHAPLAMTHDDFTAGGRIAVVGLVGDRLGLYRLWPRNQSDIAIIPVDPSPTPTAQPTPTPHPTPTAQPTPTPRPTPTPSGTPTPRPSPSPTSTPGSGSVIGIADALRRVGQSVTIEGTVTTRPGLLDADAFRVAVQDATAAILVRLPTDFVGQIGQRVRVSGEIGTYYGAPQLTAATAARAGDGSISPVSVRSAPVPAGLEWRLVTLTGQVESVHRDGDTWRAEISLSGGTVPVAGLARSGIDSTALVAGRSATVIGIVKRAYPTASDQRFAVVPRGTADIDLGSGPGPGSTDPPNPVASGHPTAQPTATGTGHPGATADASGAPRPGSTIVLPPAWSGKSVVALADLSAHETETVAVGGVVEQIVGTRITVNDGTGTATIRLVGQAVEMVRLFGEGDLLNAIGTVERVATGGLEVAVTDPANVARLVPVGDPGSSITSNGPLATFNDIADDQARPDALGSTAIVAAILLALALALAAATVLSVPSARNAARDRANRALAALRNRIVTLRSG